MRRCFKICLTTIALGAVVGCAGELEGDEASYRAQHEPGCNVVPIFAQRCGSAFCHGGATPPGDLDLASEGVRSRLAGVAAKGTGCEGGVFSRLLIDTSDVDRSYVLEKIESTSPQCGGAMPLTGRLTDAEKACIRTWATALAGGPSKHDSGASPGPDAGAGTPDSSAPVVDSGGTP